LENFVLTGHTVTESCRCLCAFFVRRFTPIGTSIIDETIKDHVVGDVENLHDGLNSIRVEGHFETKSRGPGRFRSLTTSSSRRITLHDRTVVIVHNETSSVPPPMANSAP
jgi:hypothetical protein